jgi:hypothetical protein
MGGVLEGSELRDSSGLISQVLKETAQDLKGWHN